MEIKEGSEWRFIPNYEGLYLVNKFGGIYSIRSRKKLKYSLTTDGYKQYILYKNKKPNNMLAHRAVALSFIPNPNNLPLVNHKDENKLNCFFENLEWCDAKYNVTYSGNKSAQAMFEKNAKCSYVYDLELNLIGVFRGLRKFGRENGIARGNLSTAINYNKTHKKLRRCKNFILSYDELKV